MLKTSILLIFAALIAVVFLYGSEFNHEESNEIIETQTPVNTGPEIIEPEIVKVNNPIRTPRNSDFKNDQKKYTRVKNAYNDKEEFVYQILDENNIDFDNINIIITAYKSEQLVDIYAKNSYDTVYKKILTYDVCKNSGVLGPKRMQGDKQVPEGFYYIERFNPVSNYYLSLGINYPNKSDRIKSNAARLGGDIFIHGECVTIGCLPMTNDKIKEIYLLAIQARQSGQSRIPVYIFPFKMTDENSERFFERYRGSYKLIEFWKNLKTGYEIFDASKKEIALTINDLGDYEF